MATPEQHLNVKADASVSAPGPQSAKKLLKEKLKGFPLLKRIRLKICSMMIMFVAKHGKELLLEYLMERASEISVKTTMVILDREGIAHCHLCPTRFQLRRVGNRYACLQHTQEVKAKVA